MMRDKLQKFQDGSLCIRKLFTRNILQNIDVKMSIYVSLNVCKHYELKDSNSRGTRKYQFSFALI